MSKPGRWSVGGVDGLAVQVTAFGASSAKSATVYAAHVQMRRPSMTVPTLDENAKKVATDSSELSALQARVAEIEPDQT